MNRIIMRANFFDDFEDIVTSRSLIISACSEEEVVDRAAVQMGDEARRAGAGMIRLGEATVVNLEY